MLKLLTLSAALLVTTSGAALAQASVPTASEAPNALQMAVQRSAVAFSQCVSTGMQDLQASVSSQAGASQVLGACSGQRDQLVTAARALIASLPEAEKATATAELESQLARAQTRVAAEIDRRRAAAPAPAPAPAPAH